MRTAELLERLHRHYLKPGERLPGGMLIPEVTHGQQGGRRCDALYIGFTSASGRILVGHELKVSRSDWLHELAHPGKADAWADECHAWYVVAPDETVVRPEEIPHGWGLLLASGARTRLTVKVKATVHADRTPSWTAVRSILSRVDTLRAGWVHDGVQVESAKLAKHYAENYVPKSRGVDELRARAHRAEQLLDAIRDALGASVVLERDAWDRRSITVDELARLAPIIRDQADPKAVRQELDDSKRVGPGSLDGPTPLPPTVAELRATRMNAYECRFCDGWHIGHKRFGVKKP